MASPTQPKQTDVQLVMHRLDALERESANCASSPRTEVTDEALPPTSQCPRRCCRRRARCAATGRCRSPRSRSSPTIAVDLERVVNRHRPIARERRRHRRRSKLRIASVGSPPSRQQGRRLSPLVCDWSSPRVPSRTAPAAYLWPPIHLAPSPHACAPVHSTRSR